MAGLCRADTSFIEFSSVKLGKYSPQSGERSPNLRERFVYFKSSPMQPMKKYGELTQEPSDFPPL